MTDDGRRHSLNTRTTAALRSRLEDAAVSSGRSLAAEVEHRLEGSFSTEDMSRTIRDAVRAELQAHGDAKIQRQGREMQDLIAAITQARRPSAPAIGAKN